MSFYQEHKNPLQRSRHLFDVLCTVWIENVADLKHFERLLNLSLLPEDEALHVVGVLAHPVGLFQLRPDDRLADLELAPDVVGVDQPVSTLEGWEFGS